MIDVIYFQEGYDEVTVEPIYQWDYGRKLRISGLDLPLAVQVHFCDKSCDKAIIHIAYKHDDYWEVPIPNALLQNSYGIQAYIYLTDEASGKTTKTIHIPITARTKPADFISEPDPTAEEKINES